MPQESIDQKIEKASLASLMKVMYAELKALEIRMKSKVAPAKDIPWTSKEI